MFAIIPLIASLVLLKALAFDYPEAPVSIEIFALVLFAGSFALTVYNVARFIERQFETPRQRRSRISRERHAQWQRTRFSASRF